MLEDILSKLEFINMHGKIEISNRPYQVHMGIKTEVWGAEIQRSSDYKVLYESNEDIGVLLDNCVRWIQDGYEETEKEEVAGMIGYSRTQGE